MSKLFGRGKFVIFSHIKTAMNEELIEISTVAKFATVQIEGAHEVEIEIEIEYYNLDMII